MEKRMTDIKKITKFYGTTWCGDTRRARKFFDEHKLEYEWIDIDQDKDARDYVESVNDGCRSVPTIVFPDGRILVEPSLSELREATGITD
jgi:glutaredoxin-like protein